MLFIISPAKTLDFNRGNLPSKKYTEPIFQNEVSELVQFMKSFSRSEIESLFGVSKNIADLNYVRYQEFEKNFTIDNSKQALFAFMGDVYRGLEAKNFDEGNVEYAQKHLRILSGLYGLLRPLDLMQPYRLEMGTKFRNNRFSDLYNFWGDKIAQKLDCDYLINLASKEYFKSVEGKVKANVINIVFKENRNGELKIIAIMAKKARGMMSNFLIKNRINKPEGIKDFTSDGYRFDKSLSSETEYIFVRQ